MLKLNVVYKSNNSNILSIEQDVYHDENWTHEDS